MGLLSLQGLVKEEVASLLVPRSRHALKAHLNPALPGISSTQMLCGATRPAIPSCDFAPLQGFLPKDRSPPYGGENLSWTSLPFDASVPRESTYPRRFQLRVTFRVQGFSPSWRFTPLSALRVCFTPHTSCGFTLQGVPLSGSRADSSPASCRHAVLPSVALPPPGWSGPTAHPVSPP